MGGRSFEIPAACHYFRLNCLWRPNSACRPRRIPKNPSCNNLHHFLFLSRNALLSFLTAPCVFFRSYPKPDILRNNAGKKKKQKRWKRKFQKNVREQTMNLARHRCAFSSCVNFSSFFKFVVVVVVLAHLLHSEKKNDARSPRCTCINVHLIRFLFNCA